jgi:hypothetical protein
MMLIEATAPSATFDAALAQDAQLDFDVAVPKALGSGFGSTRCRISSFVIISQEHLAWELWLWSSATRAGANYNADTWLGFWKFAAADATVGPDGRYRYFIPDLDVAYRDDDAADVNGLIHMSLIPRGAAHVIHDKIVVKVFCAPEVAFAG